MGIRQVFAGIIMARAISHGFVMFMNGIRAMTDEVLEFDQAVTVASAKFQDAPKPGTKQFKRFQDSLRGAAREIGAVTEFTAAQAAKGLEEYAKAGLSASSAMKLLSGTAELATNANTDMAQAANIALGALDSFGLRSENAITTERNLADVNDVLAKVVNSAKIEMDDFNQTMKFSGAVASATGAGFRDMAVLTGLVARANIKGSLAGTTLKSAYLGLTGATPKAEKALNKLGIKTADSEGNMRDMLDVLLDMKGAMKNMGTKEQLKTINAIFGRRAIAGISAVLQMDAKSLRDYRDNINDATGASSKMATTIRESLTNKLKVLKSMLVEVGFKFIDAIGGDAKGAVDQLQKMVFKIKPQAIINALKPFLKLIKSIFRFLTPFGKALFEVGKVIFDIASSIATSLSGLLDSGSNSIGTYLNIDPAVHDTFRSILSLFKDLGRQINMAISLFGTLMGIVAPIGQFFWQAFGNKMFDNFITNLSIITNGMTILLHLAGILAKSVQNDIVKAFDNAVQIWGGLVAAFEHTVNVVAELFAWIDRLVTAIANLDTGKVLSMLSGAGTQGSIGGRTYVPDVNNSYSLASGAGAGGIAGVNLAGNINVTGLPSGAKASGGFKGAPALNVGSGGYNYGPGSRPGGLAPNAGNRDYAR